jgi:hypothetical protein
MKGKVLGLFYRYKTVGGVDYVSDFLIAPRDRATPLNNYPGNSGTLWFEDDESAPRNANGAQIRAYATSQISDDYPKLQKVMEANADNIGLEDNLLNNLKPYKHGDFSPLADVADLVWRFTRKADENNHFADMDKPGKDGKTLLELCAASSKNIDPNIWNHYYEGIGEERRGALPFRVWHSIYETTMIGRHGADLLKMIPRAEIKPVLEITPNKTPTGRDAAVAVVALMQRTVDRLPPLTIVNLFDSNMGRGQIETMWNKLKDPTAACMQDGAKTLARIWEAAWRAGNGEHWSEAGKFTEGQFEALYPCHPIPSKT